METKTADIAIKRAGEGKATVVIATMGVKDRDGDVILPGAFGDQWVQVAAAHDYKSVWIGKAHIYEVGNEAVADLEFNDTTLGQDWYKAIKFDWDHPPAKGQYSWGFEPLAGNQMRGQHNGDHVRFLKATDEGIPIPIHEVSPVMVAAGRNTRSVIVKEAVTESKAVDPPPPLATPEPLHVSPPSTPIKRSVTPHHTQTDDRVWDASLQQRHVKATSTTPNYYRQFYAIADHGDETKRQTWRFLHHFVSTDGEVGSASVRSCVEGIMALHKGIIPGSERRGIYDHLATHLKDAGVEPPEFPQTDGHQLHLDTIAQMTLWAVDDVINRVMSIHDLRTAKGMTLSQARIDQMQTLQHRIDVFCQVINIKRLDLPYDAQVDELREQEHIRQLDQRINDMKQKVETEQAQVHDLQAEEHYRRFQAIQRRLLKED